MRGNKNSKRRGVTALQYSTATGSEMETAMRSDMPKKPSIRERKAVTGLDLLKSDTCG